MPDHNSKVSKTLWMIGGAILVVCLISVVGYGFLSVNSSQATLAKELAASKEQIITLKSDLAACQGKVNEAGAGLTEQKVQIGEKVVAQEKATAELNKQVSALQKAQAEHTTALANANTATAGLNQRIDEVVKNLGENVRNVTAQGKTIEGLKGTTADQTKTLNLIDGQLGAQAKMIDTVSKKVDAQATTITATSTKFDGLNEKVTAQEKLVGTLKVQLDSVSVSVAKNTLVLADLRAPKDDPKENPFKAATEKDERKPEEHKSIGGRKPKEADSVVVEEKKPEEHKSIGGRKPKPDAEKAKEEGNKPEQPTAKIGDKSKEAEPVVEVPKEIKKEGAPEVVVKEIKPPAETPKVEVTKDDEKKGPVGQKSDKDLLDELLK